MNERAPALDVRVLASAADAWPRVLDEVRRAVAGATTPLLGFATGGTFTGFWPHLAGELQRLSPAFLATHLDEYVGFPPERRGGMVHELESLCAPLRGMRERGTFLPVPHVDSTAAIAAHERRLRAAGGLQLQLLGIGRNGHLAFNEPGTPFDSGFHVTRLAASTREDARARFRPDEPPLRAVTAGLGTICGARRIVLCAFGEAKAAAVRAMLQGDVSPTCPASGLRAHGSVLVLLDPAAAAGLVRRPG